jgi:cytochrome c553
MFDFYRSSKKISLSLSALIAVLAFAFSANSVQAASKQSIARGQALVKEKNCASCHGQDFWNSTAAEYPRLAGQHRDYLYYALLAYKQKGNGFGRDNAIMMGQVSNLTQQDLKDISNYLSTLPSEFILKK